MCLSACSCPDESKSLFRSNGSSLLDSNTLLLFLALNQGLLVTAILYMCSAKEYCLKKKKKSISFQPVLMSPYSCSLGTFGESTYTAKISLVTWHGSERKLGILLQTIFSYSLLSLKIDPDSLLETCGFHLLL